jgi:hypothetical protein
MTAQQPTQFKVPWKALLFAPLVSFVVALAVAGGVGGVTLGVAPNFSIGLVAPLVCPLGTQAQYTAVHNSYDRPGQSTPLVECVSSTGTRNDVTGLAILAFFVVAIAVVFVPVFLLNVVLALRQPQRQTASSMSMPAPPAARQAAHDEIAQRLQRLEALRAEGTITAQEYDQKRKEILSGL